MWHIVIQCTVVLGLSSKDMRPYPNTLLIRSLPGVNFWVFHPRNLTPFLIRLTWTFTFHYYFIYLFIFHLMHFSQFLSFLHTTMMQMKCHEVNYPHSKVSPISHKFSTSLNIIEITIIPQFHDFPITPIIPIIKYNYCSTIKLPKATKQISNNSNLN